MHSEPNNQFSLTCVALSTRGRAKSKFPPVSVTSAASSKGGCAKKQMLGIGTCRVSILPLLVVLITSLAAIRLPGAAVSFDAPLSCACSVVQLADFSKRNPNIRVVQARIKITADLAVKESSLDSIRYDLEFPLGVEVHDYLPKTELGSGYDGPISVTSSQAQKGGYQVSLNASGKLEYILASVQAGGSASIDSARTATSGIQASLLPPKRLLVAAGTTSRNRGIYWKLKPMEQVTLEGQREFVCLLTVPVNWDGGCIALSCLAKMAEGGGNFSQNMRIGIYVEGDQQGKGRVEKEATEFQPLRMAQAEENAGIKGQNLSPKDQQGNMSYAIGMNIGNSIKRGGVELDVNTMSGAIKDVLAGRTMRLTDQQAQEAMRLYQMEARAKHEQTTR